MMKANEIVGDVNTGKEKHIKMHEAIKNMDGIIYRLDELIWRIEASKKRGEEINANELIPEVVPSFMDVLDGGPEAIREITDSALERINRLMEMLF